MWWKPWTWYPRVVRAVTTRDPEWDDEQFDMMMSFVNYENDIHPDCGHPLSETTSPLADPNNPQGEYIFKAQLPLRCHACTAIEEAQRGYRGEHYDPARIWIVDRIER